MSTLLIVILILAVMVSVVGIVGAVVPALPGPPLSLLSLVTVYLACPGTVSLVFLIIMSIAVVVVTVLDYVAPVILTKVGGGSRYATWGSTLGLVVGLFFMPLGLIVGPLVGAFLGELYHGSTLSTSFKVSVLSFVAFLITTGLKLVLSLILTFEVIRAIWVFALA